MKKTIATGRTETQAARDVVTIRSDPMGVRHARAAVNRPTPGADRRAFLKLTGFGLACGTGNALGVLPFARGSSAWAAAAVQKEDLPLERVTQITAATAIGSPTVIVAGSNGPGPARWASALLSSFSEALPTETPIVMRASAGQDGVTGANLFDSQSTGGNGENALLVPGAAVIAAQTGDSRVHFDYQRWLPVMLSLGAPVAVGRVDMRRSLRTLLQDRPVRVAVSAPNGLELPTMLAMTMLSMRVIPISGFGIPEVAIEALKRGDVDVVQIPAMAGRDALLKELASSGFEPLFAVTGGTAGPSGGGPGAVPDFATRFAMLRGHAPTHPLYPAFLGTAAAASVDMAFVLPMLTAPAIAARWRHAASLAAAQPAITALAQDNGTHLVAGTASASAYAALTPDLSAVLALRRWLAERGPTWRVG